MTPRYELIHDEEDGTWDVVAHYDELNRFEGWGSFKTQEEALASIAEHKAKHSRH